MKFKVTENFYSLQGEGRFTGVPSNFLRLFGCNFKCSGFGMPKGEESQERKKIAENIENYKTLDDIPLARTGCDSFVSWDPKFKKFSKSYESSEVVNLIKESIKDVEKTKESNFLHIGNNKDIHLVITGGEPLLSWQKAYPELFDLINKEMSNNKWYLTFETNGTQKLHKDFIYYLNENTNIDVTFSTSPKLSESGELWEKAIKPEVIESFKEVHNSYVYSKFVVGKIEELDEVEQAISELKLLDEVMLMSVGGCYEEYIKLAPTVATWCMNKGYRYTPRLHVDLFRNSWGV